jgi:hypothetical protein
MGEAKLRYNQIQELKKTQETPVLPLKEQLLQDDFVQALHNGLATEFQVIMYCMRLGKYKGFGLIIPRKFLSNITVPYLTEELPWNQMNHLDSTTGVYKRYDAVMVKNAQHQITA